MQCRRWVWRRTSDLLFRIDAVFALEHTINGLSPEQRVVARGRDVALLIASCVPVRSSSM
jgi:hypothetical protein